MQRACLLASVFVIVLSVGCGKKVAGLSGTYKRQPPIPGSDVTMTFQEDGTFVGKNLGGAGKGRYKLEGRKLTITTTEMNGKLTQGKEAEPITTTLSEDGRSISDECVQLIRQE